MNPSEVLALLEQHKNEVGIKKWKEKYGENYPVSSYGIGLTVLRKLAKQIGRNHELALELWDLKNYDAKIIGMLIDEPKKMTRQQVEVQVKDVKEKHLAHVFSSCDASLAKTSFVVELASDWVKSEDAMRRSCGYGLLYELSKSKKKSAPDDSFFLDKIEHISSTFEGENFHVKGAMGGALMGMGKRSKVLNQSALKVAKQIGPIQVGDDKSNCEPFDVVKHLTSDYIKQKLGL